MKEWIGCAAWVGLSIAVLIAGADLQIMTRFGPGPGFFLRGLAIVLLGLAVVQAVTLFSGRNRVVAHAAPSPENPAAILDMDEGDGPLDVTPGTVLRFVLLAAALFAYGALIEHLGFLVATTALCWAAMTLLGRKPLRSLLESAVAILIAYFVFSHLLGVNLPAADIAPLAALKF